MKKDRISYVTAIFAVLTWVAFAAITVYESTYSINFVGIAFFALLPLVFLLAALFAKGRVRLAFLAINIIILLFLVLFYFSLNRTGIFAL